MRTGVETRRSPKSTGEARNISKTLAAIARDPAIPRNLAWRPNRAGFFARVAECFGFSLGQNKAAFAARIGFEAVLSGPLGHGAIFGPNGGPGASSVESVGGNAVTNGGEVSQETTKDLSCLKDALRFLGDRSALMTLLETRTPRQLAELDRALGLGYGSKKHLSLREAIAGAFKGEDRRRALGLLEDAFALLRRPDGEPLHEIDADPLGLAASVVDGRLPQTIDKLLELRRLGRINKSDLVSRHEVTSNNRAHVLASAPRAFEEITRAIDGARDFVHLSFFIVKNDGRGRELTKKLIERAKAGVKVRIVFDEGGTILGGAWTSRRLIHKLRAAGVEVIENRLLGTASPLALANAPDHRKTVVVDGRIGFTGGMNVGEGYIDEWHDLFMKIEGDTVHQLNVDFMTNWIALGGEVDRGASDDAVRERYFPELPDLGTTRVKLAQTIPGQSREILAAYLQAINGAKHSIWIENPYITSREIQDALLAAALRGVDVRIIIPGKNNHPACDMLARGAFRSMLEAGVKIFEFDGMCHGKVMVVDERCTIFGTANLDDLSLRRNYEENLHIAGRATAFEVLQEIFDPDLERASALGEHHISKWKLVLSALLSPLRRWL